MSQIERGFAREYAIELQNNWDTPQQQLETSTHLVVGIVDLLRADREAFLTDNDYKRSAYVWNVYRTMKRVVEFVESGAATSSDANSDDSPVVALPVSPLTERALQRIDAVVNEVPNKPA